MCVSDRAFQLFKQLAPQSVKILFGSFRFAAGKDKGARSPFSDNQ
jgi:hypothetical protein